jgi:DNA polymerase elongation subunit (family B)
MYRNISYYTDPVDKQGMVILDTWDENGERVTKHLPAHSSLWYEDDRGTETSMFNTKLSHRVFPNNFERYNWMKGDRRKRYFECLPPTKEFLFNMYKGQQENPEFTKYDLRVFYTDIEIAVEDEFPDSDEAKYPINVITIFDSLKRKYHIWHLNDKGITFEDEDDKEFYGFYSEFKMLNHFVDWFINNRPDVISGWNVLGFDMPYIINRVEKKCARSKEFSPVGKVRALEMKPKEKNYVIKYYSVEGLSILDQLILYRDKFVFKKQPQYTLDHIGDIVLQGYKMGKKVVTKVENDIESAEFTGAYVFPTQAGVYHRGVFSVDLNSLYPNIMITLNMSPETKVGVIIEENDEHVIIRRADGKNQTIPVDKMQELLAHNLTKSANGVLYFKHHIKKGILPVFLERVYNDRQADRKKGFEHEQKSKEISSKLDLLDKLP